MKIVFFLFFLFRVLLVPAQTDLKPLPLHAITPSADRNYTIRYRPHFGVTSVSHRLGLSGSEATISYFDGLGRCVQVVESGANPDRLDLITPVSPDFYGREGVKSYLPYAGGTDKGIYNTGAQSAQNNYYGGLYGSSGGNAYAYSERRYEESGAGRLLESSRPGAPYRLSGGHTIRYNYGLNGGNEVRRYVYTNGNVSSPGYFAAGTLYRQEISGEDDRRRIVFTNFRGDAVLERCYASSGEALDTYYVYDVLDRLVCVIPPLPGDSAAISPASLSAYCYRYSYDKRGNITERILPGVVTEKIGYNAAGLPVSRDQGDRHFMLSYDNHNRLLQESYRYGSGSSIVLAERRYDSYPSVNGLGFVAATGYASAYDSRVMGLQTYEKERILAGNSVSEPGLPGRYVERCFYYDSKGRLIQRVEKNHLGGVSRYHYAYDFVGNVTSECETHTIGGVTTSLEKINNYDHISRLLCCKVYLNGVYKGKVDYGYDALGRLSARRYGENAATEALSYDIRGRLTSQGSSFFRLGLRYENAQKGRGLYGGDISEWSCRYGSKAEQLYTFTYDGAGRFTGGNHYENGVLVNKYVEQGINYDKNGNILSLKRYNNGVLVDNLAYSYNGNRLVGLTESAVVASGDIYERKNVSGGSYDYDIYGNLSKDSRKNLNFEYNILNLLHNVREGSTLMTGYEYGYGGDKLKVSGRDGSGYAYVGNLVYWLTGSSFVFESGLFGEGVVSSNGICYHLKDHLGSIRAIVDGSGRLLEENDYYAFGQRHPRSEHAQSSANRFKYNGKELQTVGGLGYLDYGARMYDQSLGRWFTTDPLSEKYYGLSPYVYCGNNPINAVDLCGDSITTVVNATITNPDGTTSLQRTRYYYGQNSNGTYGFIDNNGNLYSGTNTFVNSLTTALNNLRMGGNVGNTLVSDLVSSTKNVQIAQGKNTADLNGAYIKWNPNSTTGGMNQIGTENRPAYIGLGHEMAHIQDCWRGTIDNTTWVTVGGTAIPNAEKYATHIENQLRAENDIPLRTHYGIDASSGRRVGLESTRIIKGNLSLFYNQSNGASLMGVPLLYIPFFYRKK